MSKNRQTDVIKNNHPKTEYWVKQMNIKNGQMNVETWMDSWPKPDIKN